jgi:hypothetical protein
MLKNVQNAIMITAKLAYFVPGPVLIVDRLAKSLKLKNLQQIKSFINR